MESEVTQLDNFNFDYTSFTRPIENPKYDELTITRNAVAPAKTVKPKHYEKKTIFMRLTSIKCFLFIFLQTLGNYPVGSKHYQKELTSVVYFGIRTQIVKLFAPITRFISNLWEDFQYRMFLNVCIFDHEWEKFLDDIERDWRMLWELTKTNLLTTLNEQKRIWQKSVLLGLHSKHSFQYLTQLSLN